MHVKAPFTVSFLSQCTRTAGGVERFAFFAQHIQCKRKYLTSDVPASDVSELASYLETYL